MRPGFEEPVHPQFPVALQAEDLNLDGMYESVHHCALRHSLVEGDDVEERERIHVRSLGWFKAEGSHLGEEIRHSYQGSSKFDNANAVQQPSGKVRPHAGLAQIAERSGDRGIVLALFTQVTGEPFNRLIDLSLGWLPCGRTRYGLGNLAFDAGIEVVEGGRSLGGLAQDVTPAEAREIVGRIVKAKLMNCVVCTEQLELSFLELGVHLQDGNMGLWILKRGHRGLPYLQWNFSEGPKGKLNSLYIVSFTTSTLFLLIPKMTWNGTPKRWSVDWATTGRIRLVTFNNVMFYGLDITLC